MAVALTSFHALERFVAQGDELANTDPIVAAFPSLFEASPPAEARKVLGKKAPAAKKAAPKAQD